MAIELELTLYQELKQYHMEFVDNDFDFSDDNADDIYELMNLLQHLSNYLIDFQILHTFL